jgi:hypothetical protein
VLFAPQGFTERPELKDLDENVVARPASTIFSILFALLSIVLISLFIGTFAICCCVRVMRVMWVRCPLERCAPRYSRGSGCRH